MSMREAANASRISKSSVQRWVTRAGGRRLDRADVSDRKSGRAWNRTSFETEQRIAQLRAELRDSVLGECGACAIASALRAQGAQAPSEATINRVLARLGLQDGARRTRRPAPPRGWYLPQVAAGRVELDCFDFIEDLKIANGPLIDVLTCKSLHGALTDAWVLAAKSTNAAMHCLLQRWQRDGLPAYAQFDNDTVFQGAHQFADTIGAVSRMCLQLSVTPVFVPPLEHGMQNVIEGFNGLWQGKVWQRHRVIDASELQRRSDLYIAAHRARIQPLADAAPQRTRMPNRFSFVPQAPLTGQIIFLRRTDANGYARLLGRAYDISRAWLHRLVRCEVDFDHHEIRCFALRRHAPADQPLLATIPYHRVDKPFKGEL